jgi:nucleoside transporter
MNMMTKVNLSVMMLLEFLIWGAWFVTMGTYLGNLGFTGGQIGNAYITTAIAAIISPIFVGMIADKFFPAQRILGILHLAGAALMYWVSTITSPGLFFWALLAYALCYMPTLALTNAIAFNQMKDSEKEFPVIRAIGTLGWIVVGLFIGFSRLEATNVPMLIAAGASLLLGLYSFALPHTPPKGAGQKVTVVDILGIEALRLMKDRYFAVFVVASLLVAMTTSFYFGFANLYFNDSGMQYTAAIMTGGQFSEAIFIALLAFFFSRLGIKTIMTLGMLAWSVRYFLMAFGGNEMPGVLLWYLAIIIHGLCFGFFFIAGQVYVEKVAPKAIQASAQGFIALVTFGIGHGLGAKFSGMVVDMFTTEAGRDWTTIWLIPAVISLVVGILFFLFFKVKPAEIPVAVSAD